MKPGVHTRRLLSAFALLLCCWVLWGCNSPSSAANDEKLRRINLGADPNTVQGKQSRAMMDGQLVPAPQGVKTGFEGGLKK